MKIKSKYGFEIEEEDLIRYNKLWFKEHPLHWKSIKYNFACFIIKLLEKQEDTK